jgi:hypothetical protein
VGKLTIDLDDSVELRLRRHIGATYLKPHGKIKEVMEKAITDYCSRADITRFVDSLDLGPHALLVGDDVESVKRVELEFITRSLAKGHNTVVLEQGARFVSAQTVMEEARGEGIELEPGAASRLLRVVEVPDDGDYAGLAAVLTFSPLTKMQCPFAVPISGSFDISTPERLERRMALDAQLHEAFDTRATMLCSYSDALGDPPNELTALGRLMQIHTSAVFALVSGNLVLGRHDTAGESEASARSTGSATRQTYPGGSRTA